jgi:dTMP kinase
MINKSRYIVFEGIDLVGKTTQIDLLKLKFPEFIFTKEPGGTSFGKDIRDMVLFDDYSLDRVSEFLLFLADRSETFKRVIKPNLESGKTIISDRSLFSGMAYAIQNGGIPEEKIVKINLLTVSKRLPDLVIFFEISEQELKKRRISRGLDNVEERGIKYALQVQEYLKYLIEKFEVPVFKIKASDTPNSIYQKILKKIEEETKTSN